MINLTATWHPRGELSRFMRLFARIREAYEHMALVIPPDTDADIVSTLEEVQQRERKKLSVHTVKDWSRGRHTALEKALISTSEHVHYADLDRLLRWIETNPQEWLQTIEKVKQSDYLIIGRSQRAYRTHPQSLIHTEAISNYVVSHLVGREMDVSAGSKGFSRRCVEFLVKNGIPGRALGTDAEWTVLLHRAGFSVDYVTVDGLDWEIADRFRPTAADGHRQNKLAKEYDRDSNNWAKRVEIAFEIVQSGIEASQRDIDKFK